MVIKGLTKPSISMFLKTGLNDKALTTLLEEGSLRSPLSFLTHVLIRIYRFADLCIEISKNSSNMS